MERYQVESEAKSFPLGEILSELKVAREICEKKMSEYQKTE